ncbi:hypothetical protein ABZP36_007593 [Zizania latifolia]
MERHRLRLLAVIASALLLLATTASMLSTAEEGFEEDPLIEQVVGASRDDDELGELNAEVHFTSFERRFGKS